MKIQFRFTMAVVIAALVLQQAKAAPKAALPEKTLASLLGPLLEQAQSRTVRIMMGGTSIATFWYSNNELFVSQLKGIYGDACADVERAGALTGSWDLPIQNWYKQPYSGPSFVRLRGDSNSLPLDIDGYGSKIIVEYSKEADGGTSEIDVDNAVVGTVNCSGPQQLSVKAVYQVAEGLHHFTIRPPVGGFAYLERVTFEQDRPGIEIIDGSLGGSGLINVYSVFPRGGQTVPGIATQPGVGVRSYFGRPDIDLVIWSGPVNDSGGGNPDFATWSSRMNEVVDSTRPTTAHIVSNATGNQSVVVTKTPHGLKTGDTVKISGVTGSKPAINGTQTVTVLSPTTFSVPVAVTIAGHNGTVVKAGCPLVLIAEMGGHFSIPQDPDHAAFLEKYEYLKQLGRDNAHVFTVDWHGATADSDIVRYAANYYTGVTVDPSTGANSGDFIHPNDVAHQVALNLLCQSLDIPVPPEALSVSVDNRVRKTSPVAAGTRIRFPDGKVTRSAAVSGLGASVYSALTYVTTLPMIFSANTANLSDWNQQIAASPTSDGFGKYIDYPQDTPVPIFNRNLVGERVTVTALMKPSVPGLMRIIPPGAGQGTIYYKNSVINGCTAFLYDPEEMPMWVTFDFARGDLPTMLVTGRLYSISVTRTNGQPVSTEMRELALDANVQTQPATQVTTSGATLNAAVLSDGNGALSVNFDIGLDRNSAETYSGPNAVVADDGQTVNIQQPLTGLLPATTYVFRARALRAGDPRAQFGQFRQFRTRPAP